MVGHICAQRPNPGMLDAKLDATRLILAISAMDKASFYCQTKRGSKYVILQKGNAGAVNTIQCNVGSIFSWAEVVTWPATQKSRPGLIATGTSAALNLKTKSRQAHHAWPLQPERCTVLYAKN